MKKRITNGDISRMMAGAAAKIREQHAWLSELDSIAGDGDHGSTMLRTIACLEQVFTADTTADLKTNFNKAGWDVMCVDGGASTSLLGALFMGMCDGLEPQIRSLDCFQLSRAFQFGLDALQKQTKARPGDKTMMDALIPAVEAMQSATNAGCEIKAALEQAANAARTGAESTSNMTARYGRARLLGEKTRGFQDPGATSIALMFDGFVKGLAAAKGRIDNG
jgi:dihydroxyacetone kinase-like protein